MGTSRDEIRAWFAGGVSAGKTHMVIVCDTFDHDDFPAYYDSAEDARKKVANPGSMERIMEVYYLLEPIDPQISQHRCFNFGPSLTPESSHE